MPRHDGKGWFVALENAYAIHNVVAQRPELSLYVIRWDGADELSWIDLSDPAQRLKPFHFEIYFGKESARDAYYLEALAAARSGTGVHVAELFGFSDLFCPLPPDGDHHVFLYAGQIYRREPDWDTLCEQWRAISGKDPATGDADFVHFVRMALEIPVISGELEDALVEFMGLYGKFLAGSDDEPEMRSRIDALNRDYFSPLWPIEEWVSSALSPDKFHLTPWSLEGELTEWMKEGLGMSRLPTTAMAVMPLDSPTEPLDPVQTLVRNARLQRLCIAYTRELPDTAATRLSDYGVSLITSAPRSKSKGRARLALRERAQKLQAFMLEELGVSSVVGIGPTLTPGAPLYESHREAVLALHMCVQLDKPVLFFDEHGEQTALGYAALQRASTALGEALEREHSNDVKACSDHYVQVVLRYSDERLEVARSQFLATLFQLFELVSRRNPLSDEARESFADNLSRDLESAGSLYQVIEAFRHALSRLNFVSSRAWNGPVAMRLEATLRYVSENFAEPLPLSDVARRAGFSVPAFTRAFKQTTGSSFLNYVRTVRVDHAKRLLATTPMTLELVAQGCGFRSQHHLIRSFKKVTGQTPGAYRAEHRPR